MRLKKKKRGQYPAILTEQAWSIGFIIWPKYYTKEFCICRNEAGNLERARQAYFALSGSQSEHRIRFVLPARGASHIIVNSKNTQCQLHDYVVELLPWQYVSSGLPQSDRCCHQLYVLIQLCHCSQSENEIASNSSFLEVDRLPT